MKLFDLAPGFIAAALVVLGTGQGVNNDASEEKEVTKQTTENWFDVSVSGNQTLPQNQQIEAMLSGDPQAPCNEVDGALCAVRVEYDADDPAIQALISQIGTGTPPTVKDFEDLGASSVSHSYEEEQ
ncbi:hypothetical protein [Parapedobacter tibetensis]|uniref:hypothetical protein n=1 Tax=Parapedobacter tibetensis TaxID=2972951 RepID=UPI00214D895B|nr:hypothetical protein [Parapedobacter tibetensis]